MDRRVQGLLVALWALAQLPSGKPVPLVDPPDEDVRARCVAEVPADLNEAIACLDLILTSRAREVLLKSRDEEDAIAALHHGLGTTIRNEWLLWTPDTPLRSWFEERGLSHPDDMSGVVLTSYRRRQLGEPIEYKAQVLRYLAYWRTSEKMFRRGNGFE